MILRQSGRLLTVLFCLAACSSPSGPPSRGAVALFNDQTVEIADSLPDPNDLWVMPADLTRINGFVLKAEGACLDDLCIPVRQDEDNQLLVTRQGRQWFNVTELAGILRQPFVADPETNTWSFGQIPHTRASFLQDAKAPDFSLSDRDGNQVRLADFRGKKIMIVTWASW